MAHLTNPSSGFMKIGIGLLCVVMASGCSSDPAPVTPPQSPLLALTPTEYNNSVADLLASVQEVLLVLAVVHLLVLGPQAVLRSSSRQLGLSCMHLTRKESKMVCATRPRTCVCYGLEHYCTIWDASTTAWPLSFFRQALVS